MFPPRILVGLVGLVFAAGLLLAQDKKADEAKVRGQLPPGWKDLKLTDEQKVKVYKVRGDFREKIEALEKQIADLRTQERAEMFKVLTEAQKVRLREITEGGGATREAKKEDKKP